jgi:hypothetical protein
MDAQEPQRVLLRQRSQMLRLGHEVVSIDCYTQNTGARSHTSNDNKVILLCHPAL